MIQQIRSHVWDIVVIVILVIVGLFAWSLLKSSIDAQNANISKIAADVTTALNSQSSAQQPKPQTVTVNFYGQRLETQGTDNHNGTSTFSLNGQTMTLPNWVSTTGTNNTSGQQTNNNGQVGNNNVQNPTSGLYNTPPQPQIGHPSLYMETGVPCSGVPAGVSCKDIDAHTKLYQFDLVPGTMAIIGGFTVDGVSGGVYKVVQSGHVSTTVTDGFALAIITDWAPNEFWFRVNQAYQYKWAHAHVIPLSDWTTPDWAK